MPLFAENKTTSPHLLMPHVTLPAAPAPGQLGRKYNVTSELRGLANYDALEAQVIAGQVQFHWVGDVEYETPGLTLLEAPAPPIDPDRPAAPGPDSIFGTPDDVYPVLSAIIQFSDPDFETGHDRSFPIFNSTPYKLRILQVVCTITRGAPHAQMFLASLPFDQHLPLSDLFDVSRPGIYNETAHIDDRVLEHGDNLFAVCTNDYVLGRLTVLYQRV